MALRKVGRLRRGSSVTLDSNGNGTITFTPDNAWQYWVVTDVVVQTSQASGTGPFPTAQVFLNDTSPVSQEGGTRDGDLDVGRGRIEVSGADTLIIQWTGGIAGSVATATLRGELHHGTP